MDFWVGALVAVVKIALAGFLMWGGWLCLETWLLGEDADPAASPTEEAKAQSFERVASLVLLALLCTTLAGVA
jgi:hypothetical protein